MYSTEDKNPDATGANPTWAAANDSRITPFGKILRQTHIDELPQLWNIARGELSFVGPRPERTEFENMLREKIPYYDIRHLVRPGVTGWAQIRYPYVNSVEDAYERLEYDLFYLKNRSFLLDGAIVLLTVRKFITDKD